MKIKHEDKDASGKLKFTNEQLEQLKKYGLFGIPKEDKKGHTGHISVRVQPLQMDLVEGIKEKIPGWYKSNSQLYRAVIAAGTFVVLCLVDKDENVNELKGILKDLNFIEKLYRIEDLEKQMKEIKRRFDEGDVTDKEKGKVINLLERIERKYKQVLDI